MTVTVWELEITGFSAKRTDPESVRSGLESVRSELDKRIASSLDKASFTMTTEFVETVIRERRRIHEEEERGRFSLPMLDSAITIEY
eukprot:gene29500-5847_t